MKKHNLKQIICAVLCLAMLLGFNMGFAPEAFAAPHPLHGTARNEKLLEHAAVELVERIGPGDLSEGRIGSGLGTPCAVAAHDIFHELAY